MKATNRLSLLILLPVVISQTATAQRLAAITPVAVVLQHRSMPHVAEITIGMNNLPICDGSEVRAYRSRKSTGKVMIFGGLGAAILAPALIAGTNTSAYLTVSTVASLISLTGVYVYYSADLDPLFWDQSLARIKNGQSTIGEVRQCFGDPNGTMTMGTDATWTYSMFSSGFWWFGGSARSVEIAMKSGLVSSVRRTELGMP